MVVDMVLSTKYVVVDIWRGKGSGGGYGFGEVKVVVVDMVLERKR